MLDKKAINSNSFFIKNLIYIAATISVGAILLSIFLFSATPVG
jgi:hypothetical protein